MANTYVAIATVTVGSGGAASMEFASISGTYTDLLLRVSGRNNDNGSVNSPILMEINSLTTGYSNRYIYGNGASAFSATNGYTNFNKLFGGEVNGNSSTASTFGSSDIYIPNYAGSNAKSMSVDAVSENNATTAYPVLAALLSSNTGAITNIKVYPYNATNWLQYTTATLYGIKNS
jgi:hypothetical protein